MRLIAMINQKGGVGATTPIGAIRVEYGVTRSGRNGMFVRLGEWY